MTTPEIASKHQLNLLRHHHHCHCHYQQRHQYHLGHTNELVVVLGELLHGVPAVVVAARKSRLLPIVLLRGRVVLGCHGGGLSSDD